MSQCHEIFPGAYTGRWGIRHEECTQRSRGWKNICAPGPGPTRPGFRTMMRTLRQAQRSTQWPLYDYEGRDRAEAELATALGAAPWGKQPGGLFLTIDRSYNGATVRTLWSGRIRLASTDETTVTLYERASERTRARMTRVERRLRLEIYLTHLNEMRRSRIRQDPRVLYRPGQQGGSCRLPHWPEGAWVSARATAPEPDDVRDYMFPEPEPSVRARRECRAGA